MTAPTMSYNLEAEIATVGAALVNAGAAILVASWLTADMFYDSRLAAVWGAWLVVHTAGVKPNIVTVMAELRRNGGLDRIGGFDYLNSLTDLPAGVVSTAIEDYAHQVEECYVDRQLLTASRDIARIAQDRASASVKKLGDVQQVVSAIQPRGGRQGLVHIGGSVNRQRAQLRAVQAGATLSTGTLTGYRDIDEILGGGLQNSDLVILAARPSVGKTSMLLSLGYNVANAQDHEGRDRDVLVFSLEMTRDQLTQRLVAMESRIDVHRIRTSHIRKDELEMFMASLDAVESLPIFVNDTPAVPVSYVRNEVYRHIAERGKPALIAVDYLQLMTAPGFKADNRVGLVSSISQELKALAKEIDCPVLALSQLSRNVESRTSQIPMLSDLRDSGSIEQDADVVMFIYREELYDKESDKKGIAEIHIAKSRNGPIGVVPMWFDAATTRFNTLTYRTPEGY